MRKKQILTGVVAGVLVAVLFLIYFVFFKTSTITVNKTKIKVEIVSTQESRQKGLSGRSILPKDSGMLFDFQTDDYYCFWMKDMKIPIDMIWINSENKVVDVEQEVNPNTYPQQFCPDNKARYVLEINSGQAKQLNIQNGTYIKL